MLRDKLIMLKAGFLDPAFPDRPFYCWHCMLLEGVLATFAEVQEQVDVVRTAWPKPRYEVIELLGPDHQSLPVLVFGGDAPSGIETRLANENRFVKGVDAILSVLARRHGLPSPHP